MVIACPIFHARARPGEKVITESSFHQILIHRFHQPLWIFSSSSVSESRSALEPTNYQHEHEHEHEPDAVSKNYYSSIGYQDNSYTHLFAGNKMYDPLPTHWKVLRIQQRTTKKTREMQVLQNIHRTDTGLRAQRCQ